MSALAVPPASTPSTAVSALSLDQAKAALALARGGTVSAAADSIGVHRSSIYHLFKSDPNFKQAIEEVRREWNERLIDEMRRIESLALLRLRHILEDDSVPSGVQLRAALTILTRLKETSVSPEWSLPHMESLGYTIDEDPLVVEPPTFDTIRQNSTLFAISGGESRPRADLVRGECE